MPTPRARTDDLEARVKPWLLIVLAAMLLAAPARAGNTQATNEQIIRTVFGPYGSQAVAVARCESGLSTYAQNGQYLGLFQMGYYARSLYGHGADAWTQARAAFRYFRASGYRWTAWTCRPY